MESIVHLSLTPASNAKLTPLEVLEDFADATPHWQYLEEDTTHYAREKGVEACILRHRTKGRPSFIDFVFADPTPEAPTELQLHLLDAPDAEDVLAAADRDVVVQRFVSDLRNYLAPRAGHVSLRVNPERAE